MPTDQTAEWMCCCATPCDDADLDDCSIILDNGTVGTMPDLLISVNGIEEGLPATTYQPNSWGGTEKAEFLSDCSGRDCDSLNADYVMACGSELYTEKLWGGCSVRMHTSLGASTSFTDWAVNGYTKLKMSYITGPDRFDTLFPEFPIAANKYTPRQYYGISGPRFFQLEAISYASWQQIGYGYQPREYMQRLMLEIHFGPKAICFQPTGEGQPRSVVQYRQHSAVEKWSTSTFDVSYANPWLEGLRTTVTGNGPPPITQTTDYVCKLITSALNPIEVMAPVDVEQPRTPCSFQNILPPAYDPPWVRPLDPTGIGPCSPYQKNVEGPTSIDWMFLP